MSKKTMRVNWWLIFGLSLALVMVATILVISRPQQAKVTFPLDSGTGQSSLKISSPTGVSAAQVKLDISEAATIGDTHLSGFLTGSTHLSQGREHRWFQLSANNDKEGSLAIVIELPEGTTCVVTLLGVDLKDSRGSAIPIATSFPIHVTIGPAP